MVNGTVEHTIKQSVLYTFMLSQPLAVYADAYPVLQNKQLMEAEQIQYGEHGETVRVLQQKLNDLSYYDDKIDGDFGILTEHAVKKFQAAYNIHITGQADIQTLYALIKAEKKLHLKQVEELSDSIYPGLHNEDVKIVQKALQYFGYYEGEIDGIYGPLTKKALEIAEEEHGIELTNEVTKTDLTSLYETEEIEKPKQEVKDKKQEVKKVEIKGYDNSSIIQVAYSLIGTPYVWGGESPGGFDCSGFIQYIFSTQNITTPRTVTDMWNFTSPVGTPSVGDLVFFETYKPGPSHMGIYIGDGKFIHAGESNGVEISKMKTPYWQNKYLGAKRVK